MTDIPQLDRTDRAIIGLLQHNARLSNKELAAGAGIAPSTCSERMRRLEMLGVFSGFHAAVDPRVMGIGLQAMIAIRLRRHSADSSGSSFVMLITSVNSPSVVSRRCARLITSKRPSSSNTMKRGRCRT